VPVSQALAVQKILDAMFQSSATGREVDLATFRGVQAAA
jgi:hypothetical protein